MLPLPKNLGISRDLEEEKSLHAKARAYLEGEDRAPGYHVSDLLDKRLAYFRKLHKSPIPDRLINVFIVGKVAHAIIEVIDTGHGDLTKSDSGTLQSEGISFSPDQIHKDGSPGEIKTTRSFYLPKVAYLPDDKTYHMYFEQLLSYMALMDQPVGRLTILYINSKDEKGKTAPQFYVWKVETTKEALHAYRKVLASIKAEIEEALVKKDPTGLSLCRSWKCRDCEFWEECKPQGRYGRPEKEWDKE